MQKNRHLCTIAQACQAISSQLRCTSTIGKNLLNSNISSTCPHNMVNFDPLTAKICWWVLGTTANFNGFRVLYIHFWGLLAPNGMLPAAKFTLCPSLMYSYIGSVTAWHSSSGHQPNFAAWYKEQNYGTFAEGATYIRQGGHHIGHRSTHILVGSILIFPHLRLTILHCLLTRKLSTFHFNSWPRKYW